MSESCVLDASALLCLLQEERGAERVARAFPAAEIGAANYCEVVGKFVEPGMDEAAVADLIDTLQLNVIAFDRAQARLAGLLRTTTRKLGMPLGDRACLALAQSRSATALTCESGWTRFEAPCKVELAR